MQEQNQGGVSNKEIAEKLDQVLANQAVLFRVIIEGGKISYTSDYQAKLTELAKQYLSKK